MEKKIHVLIVKKCMDIGSLESHIVRILRVIDKTKMEFDFLLDYKECFHSVEIENLGGKIYCFHDCDDKKERENELSNFVRQGNYQIVIKVIECIDDIDDLNTLNNLGIKTNVIRLAANVGIECRVIWEKLKNNTIVIVDEDSNYVIPLELCIEVLKIKNSLQLEKYRFNPIIRSQYRRELNFDEYFIVGNVARFYEAKNHKFLISIFRKFNKQCPQSKLVLVGDGELRGELEEQISQYQLEDKVVMLGMRDDIANILMAIDIFCLTSYEENTTNSILEAQASGLDCIVSDSITKKSNITGGVQYLSLNESEKWLSVLIQKYNKCENTIRDNAFYKLKRAGYDVNDLADFLFKCYMSHIDGVAYDT